MQTQKKEYKPPKRLTYFFWNGHLMKRLRVNPPRNEVFCWDFEDDKEVVMVWSHVKVHYEKAFTITDVANIFGCRRELIKHYVNQGFIRRPKRARTLKANAKGALGKWYFSRSMVLELHDFMLNRHVGSEKEFKPGKYKTAFGILSRAELISIIDQRPVVQIVDKDGNAKPIWTESIW